MRGERQEPGACIIVTCSTRVLEIGGVNRRFGIVGGKVGMGRMAIGADGRCLETQVGDLTMKAVTIGRIALSVAATATFRKFQSLVGAARFQHLVGTVASGAHRPLSRLLPNLTVGTFLEPDIEDVGVTVTAGLRRMAG